MPPGIRGIMKMQELKDYGYIVKTYRPDGGICAVIQCKTKRTAARRAAQERIIFGPLGYTINIVDVGQAAVPNLI